MPAAAKMCIRDRVSIGVKDISDVEIGNYKEKSGVYFLDAKCKTDTGIITELTHQTILANL